MNDKRVKLTLKDKILFTKRLSLLIRSGVPIASALSMLKDQAGNKNSKRIFEVLLKDVEQGVLLSSSLRKFKGTFSELVINIINVGEVSGSLEESLNYLGEELGKRHELERKLRGAMLYPLVIILATFGITGLLTVYVFPKIVPIFLNFKVKLPWTTRLLIFISDFLLRHWLVTLATIFSLMLCLIFLYNIFKIKKSIHRQMLRLPILGELISDYYLSNICRTLGLLLKSEVGIIRAIKLTAGTCGNLTFKTHLNLVAETVANGSSVGSYLKKHPDIFPPMTSQMISVGEATGSLSSSLIFLSEMYENEVEHKTKNLTSVIEPILMVIMGLLVGFIALSIITPIYAITQNIHP